MSAKGFILGVIIALFIYSSAFAQSFSTALCKDSEQFECYTVKRGQTWASLFPDEDERMLVMKLNRINVRLHGGMRIAIPKDMQNPDPLLYAPFPRELPTQGYKVIIVSLNPKTQAWGAYDEAGVLQNWGPVSGGKGWCPDIGRSCHTKTGNFSIYRKGGASCVSSKFPVGRGGAPMPYCMFFNGGFALHGSYDVPGYNASHGCVRMFIPDAEWLNEEFVQDDDVEVIITNKG